MTGGNGDECVRQRPVVMEDTARGDRLCVTYSGQTYDVTDFADRHPGGREWLVKFAGQDITDTMQQHVPHKHSKAAYAILHQYRVKQNGVTGNNGRIHFHSTVQDDLVDWSKPIYSQISGLGENYYQWVHEPVDTTLRLFHSDVLEFFSKCPWYVVPIVWVPVTILLVLRAHATITAEYVVWNLFGLETTVTSAWTGPLVFCGVLLWTLCEYTIHRWLFHMKPPSNVVILVQLHFLLHGQHHKAPMDRTRLVFPPLPASVLATIIFGIYCLFSPWAVAQALFGGTVIGYMAYDLIHYYIHHGTPALAYFANLKRYHVKHHFETQNMGFGISSKLWDYPFGTLIPNSD